MRLPGASQPVRDEHSGERDNYRRRPCEPGTQTAESIDKAKWQTSIVTTDACGYGPCVRRDDGDYADLASAPSIMATAFAIP
jgi:hypothetical protein